MGDSAHAADHLRIGKAEAAAFDFAPVEIGSENGIFAKYGIETESVGFGGGAKMHQAMAARQLDIALGSGPEMASIAKGSPEMTVAAMFGAPMNISIIVRKDSPITKIEQLKGKTIGSGPANSLTGWTALETARREGWGHDGIHIADAGGRAGIIAALMTGNVDAGVDGTEDAYELQAQGKVRILIRMGDVIPDFLGHVIFASNDLVARDPALLRRFLMAWFETIAFMATNEAATVKVAQEISRLSPAIAVQTYREQMPLFSRDGRFDTKALAVVAQAIIDTGLLDKKPDMAALYTEQYLP
ncbi:MAG TPA: ABC transporter substrate-binding protein [Stellaceae bacterium]|nr:ABC transporter substrate-binding protein [Stellaceae bacterium]